MAIYVTSKCPKCKYAFEKLQASWIAFGDPRIKCPKCGQIVLFKNIKEWKLRSLSNRIWIILQQYTIHNLVYTIPALVVIFLILAVFLTLIGKSYDTVVPKNIESILWEILGSIIFVIVGIFRHKSFIKEVKESNQRMQNKEYADQLRKFYKSFKV